MKKILMCEPDHFRVDYVINPWMKPGSVDQSRAINQWRKLKKTYEQLGLQVEVIKAQKNMPDMVFTADQGIVQGKRVLFSRFCYPERQGETQIYARWFASRGYEVTNLEPSMCCEGGELLRYQDSYFLGTGFRATQACVPQLSGWLEKPVIVLELVDARFYHLDTCLFILNESTAWYFPLAFSPSSQKVLQAIVPNLIEFSKSQALGFAANSIVVGKKVIGHTKFDVKPFGYELLEVDVSEFIKSGGGIHCLTLSLQ